ncbi:hypothetical protein LWI28_001802 [Acer negundo]|uniref:Transmembrane protein n=1 Tax=Acer negundo TaxID=4023 RepID=A0AAD5P3N4_ACENE|nr:hypothetical protein LWI28_001802 [Acer negundo]
MAINQTQSQPPSISSAVDLQTIIRRIDAISSDESISSTAVIHTIIIITRIIIIIPPTYQHQIEHTNRSKHTHPPNQTPNQKPQIDRKKEREEGRKGKRERERDPAAADDLLGSYFEHRFRKQSNTLACLISGACGKLMDSGLIVWVCVVNWWVSTAALVVGFNVEVVVLMMMMGLVEWRLWCDDDGGGSVDIGDVGRFG